MDTTEEIYRELLERMMDACDNSPLGDSYVRIMVAGEISATLKEIDNEEM